MRRTVAVSLLTVAILLLPAALSSAMGHGGGGHGGGNGGGHGGGHHGSNHGSHGHFHGHGVIVAGPFWWGPWWDPWWGYPPYYQPQVIVQPAPIYTDSPAPPESYWPESYWYYCPSAKAYYPTVPTCPEVWIKVPPHTQ